jgi:DNA-binding MarR family transcriptional regulator
MSTPISELERRLTLPKELLGSSLFLLGKLGWAIKGRVMHEFEDAGFSMYQYSVLAILARGSCEAQSIIADALSLDRSQLVGVLDDLEQRGLIERQRDSTDRRRQMVSLTGEGKRQLGKLRRTVEQIEASVLEPLDAKSRQALHQLLLTLFEHNVQPTA